MVIAETRRMHIRTLSASDVPELAAILADPEVMRHSVRGVLTECQTREFVDWCVSLYRERGFGPCALVKKQSEALVGFCGLSPESIDGAEEIHVGYRLGQQFWRQGLATEAVSAVVASGFRQHALPVIAAIVEPEHIASVRVLEKSGFSTFEQKVFRGRQVRVYRQQLGDVPAAHNNSFNPTGFSADAPKSAG